MQLVALVGVLGVAFFVAREVQRRMSFRSAHRTRVREFIEDDAMESPGLRDGSSHAVGNGRTYADHPDNEDSGPGEVELGKYKD